jgi:hypothetical protein
MKILFTEKSKNRSLSLDVPIIFTDRDVISCLADLLGKIPEHEYHVLTNVLFISLVEKEIEMILKNSENGESELLVDLLYLNLKCLLEADDSQFSEPISIEEALYPQHHGHADESLKAEDIKNWETEVRNLTGCEDYTECEGILDNQTILAKNITRPALYNSPFSKSPYKVGNWVEIKSMRVDHFMNEWFDNDKYKLDSMRRISKELKN